MNLTEIRKRFIELNKLKRKELNKMALEFGLDTRNYGTTNLTSYTYYGGYTKAEVIFDIIKKEQKQHLLLGMATEDIKIGQTCEADPKTGHIRLFREGGK